MWNKAYKQEILSVSHKVLLVLNCGQFESRKTKLCMPFPKLLKFCLGLWKDDLNFVLNIYLYIDILCPHIILHTENVSVFPTVMIFNTWKATEMLSIKQFSIFLKKVLFWCAYISTLVPTFTFSTHTYISDPNPCSHYQMLHPYLHFRP